MFGQPTSLPDSEIIDREFGPIRLLRNNSYVLRLNVRTTGEIVVSVPRRVSLADIARFIDKSRSGLRSSMAKLDNRHSYSNGDKIGQQHRLQVKSGPRPGQLINRGIVLVTVPPNYNAQRRSQLIRQAVSKALRKEAEHYLPKRLQFFATKYNYSYQRIRLTHAKSRWGSCSSSGTISLNIALMQLPERLINYVLLHELAHTKHLNHSCDFWQTLRSTLPQSDSLKIELKKYSPYL